MYVFIFLTIFYSTGGFLITSNTNFGLSNAKITDQHYIQLFDMVGQEQHARRQLQQYIVGLQKEIALAKQQVLTLKQQKDNACKLSDISKLKAEVSEMYVEGEKLKRKYKDLKSDLLELQKNHSVLQIGNDNLNRNNINITLTYTNLSNCNNDLFNDKLIWNNLTLDIEHKLDHFFHSKFGHKLEELKFIQMDKTTLESILKTIIQQLRDLNRINSARTQDFLAYIKNIGNVKTRMDELDNSLNIILNLTQKDLQLVDKHTEALALLRNKVAVTGCSTGSIEHKASAPLKFTDVRTAVGISNLNEFKRSGYFVAETSGFYMISATVMSYSATAFYYIYRNNKQLSVTYTANRGVPGKSYTGTIMFSVELLKGDKISVTMGTTMHVHGPGSCLTILLI